VGGQEIIAQGHYTPVACHEIIAQGQKIYVRII
jgi:hypothetical protein